MRYLSVYQIIIIIIIIIMHHVQSS